MNPKKIFLFVLISFFTPLFIGIILSILFLKNIYGKVLPNVYLNNEKIGGISFEETFNKVNKISLPSQIEFQYENQIFAIDSNQIELKIDVNNTVNEIFKIGRSSNLKKDINDLFTKKITQNLIISFNSESLKKELGIISENITTNPIYPEIYIENNQIKISNAQEGSEIDVDALIKQFKNNYENQNFKIINITVVKINPTISEEKIKETLNLANKINSKKIFLKHENQSFEVNNLALYIDPNSNFSIKKIELQSDEISKTLNIEAQNPIFQFENNKVKEFKPAITGIEVKKEELTNKILQGLMLLSQNDDDSVFIEIPVTKTEPEYKTEEVNDLGIKELIGVGTSKFAGSISSRVYNISLAASRVSGHLIPPGAIFSFNEAVGDISALSGYKEAYVIKDGKTTLGDGGGVCQVSTTLFRAALNTGLPIIERKSHSYRVGYYEQDAGPGLDATIYSPITDFKFKNDTSNYILIQAIFDGKKSTLKFEIYGTKDGRKVALTKPVLYDQAAPPEDIYVDEPSLPAGTIKQVEYKAWGGKSKFDYSVEKDGEIIFEKTFYSTYRPWGNVFLKGTGI